MNDYTVCSGNGLKGYSVKNHFRDSSFIAAEADHDKPALVVQDYFFPCRVATWRAADKRRDLVPVFHITGINLATVRCPGTIVYPYFLQQVRNFQVNNNPVSLRSKINGRMYYRLTIGDRSKGIPCPAITGIHKCIFIK